LSTPCDHIVGAEVLLHSLLIFYMVHAPATLLLQTTRYQLSGPQSSSGCFGKKKKPFPFKSVVLYLTLA